MTQKSADIPFPTTTAPDGWRLLDDVELMELPDPDFLIEGILQRKGIGVLYGPPGSCKTTLVADWMTAIPTRRDWFGHRICLGGQTLYVATEDASGFKVRLKAAKIAAGLSLVKPIGAYTFPESIDLRSSVSISGFIRFVKDAGISPALLVVDTYAAATPGATENSSEDTTIAMNAAQRLRDALDGAVLLVHHTNAVGTRERGHSSMRGAADTMISMTPVDDVIHLECSKQRNGAPFSPLILKLIPIQEGGRVLRLAGDVAPTSVLTANQAKLLAVLRDEFAADGATKSEWRLACPDVAERTFHRAAKMLLERGFVVSAASHFRVSEKAAR